MSVFKDEAIVLKIDKVKDKELLYTLFTKQYWKIKANKKYSKTEKTLDIWYVINFEIVTKENVKIHKIQSIKIKNQFNKDLWFTILNSYLELLSLINKNILEWIAFIEIFEIIDFINKYEKIDFIKILLAKLKVFSLLWDLKISNEKNMINKILLFISKNDIKTIFKLTGISYEIEKELSRFT